MTTSEEWSIQFDLLYNNISSNQAPGLTNYEKSIFLTQAQEALILDLYKGTTGDSFETTEEVTRYLNFLVTTWKYDSIPKDDSRNEYYIDLSEDPTKDDTDKDDVEEDDTDKDDTDKGNTASVWFITYQSAIVNGRDVLVVPTKQETLHKDLRNPFRGPNKNRLLSVSENNRLYLYADGTIQSFYLKFLRRPQPIVLVDEEASYARLSINGIPVPETEGEFEVELPEVLHNQVLLRAVQMAKAVWQS